MTRIGFPVKGSLKGFCKGYYKAVIEGPEELE